MPELFPVRRRLFARAGLPTRVRLTRPQRARLLEAMRLDKKTSNGEVGFVLARKIGTVEFGRKVLPAYAPVCADKGTGIFYGRRSHPSSAEEGMIA